MIIRIHEYIFGQYLWPCNFSLLMDIQCIVHIHRFAKMQLVWLLNGLGIRLLNAHLGHSKAQRRNYLFLFDGGCTFGYFTN